MSDPRLEALGRLLAVIDRLRGPGGCPWDRSLDPPRAAAHLVEEAHEVHAAACDGAGDGGDRAERLAEELGDALMNVLLLARIGQDSGRFDLADVADRIARKLVRRHPHVFAETEARTPEEAVRSWEGVKREERRRAGGGSALDGVPRRMPALLRAQRVGEKAAQAGFDWAEPADAVGKLAEEAGELAEALCRGDAWAVREEIGDALFSLVNVARKAGVDAESALIETTRRFEWRFRWLEQRLGERLARAAVEDPDGMERIWREAKKALDERELGLPAALEGPLRPAVRDWLSARRLALEARRHAPPDRREGPAAETFAEAERAECCFLEGLAEALGMPFEPGADPSPLLLRLADPGARETTQGRVAEIEGLAAAWTRAARRLAEGP